MPSYSLLALIYRHPWIQRTMLEEVVGEPFSSQLREIRGQLKCVYLSGAGDCLATKDTPEIGLASFWRWTIARQFVLQTLGGAVFRAGLTPGPVADGEFLCQGVWQRIWVDVGGAAPEVLRPFCHPPDQFGPQVRDILLSVDARRIPLLVALLERSWPGRDPVCVTAIGAGPSQTAAPRGRSTQSFHVYSRKTLRAFFRRREASLEVEPLGACAARLSPRAWDTLVYIGNNPLLSAGELEKALADNLAELDAIAQRIRQLCEMELLQIQPGADEARLALTWKALKLLALFWGSEEEDLQRLLPWPQRRDRWGHLAYSLRWAERLVEHTRLTRQFALAMVEAARRGSAVADGVEVDLVTLIGSRLLFSHGNSAARYATGWVTPDGYLRMRFWHCTWQDGQFGPQQEMESIEVFFEIDRATNSIARLEERLKIYSQIWSDLVRKRQVLLVWVIDGTPWRESKILSGMRACGIPGWTVTLDRLVLQKDDPVWREVPPTSRSFSYESIGGMSPMRLIWKNTQSKIENPFLTKNRKAGHRSGVGIG